MNLQYRVDLLVRLGEYILEDGPEWQQVKERASRENGWFIPAFIELASTNIARRFLSKTVLEKWVQRYQLPAINQHPVRVGIVMAGNIPMVGFHDLLCVFIAGHRAMVKTSSRDNILIPHLVEKLAGWEPDVRSLVSLAPMLKGCDAYIATGSDNSAGHFEYYFSKYPHLIRRNRTSVAILRGNESTEDLEKLADDVHLYFGLGCRNVTKIYVPEGYDFKPLLEAMKKYEFLASHHKYKNNYDYNLALQILNKNFYMSIPSLLLVEEASLFSPIGQLNYEFYNDTDKLTEALKDNSSLQCIVGVGYVPFGESQCPAIDDYADGADTMQFVSRL